MIHGALLLFFDLECDREKAVELKRPWMRIVYLKTFTYVMVDESGTVRGNFRNPREGCRIA